MKKLFFAACFALMIGTIDAQTNTNNEVYTVVDTPAEYPGGISEMMNYVKSNIHYPDSARKNNISGKCYLKFVVNKNGYIENAEVIKGVPGCKACDNEALRVVKSMPKWTPGKLKGEDVNTYYNLPIIFRL